MTSVVAEKVAARRWARQRGLQLEPDRLSRLSANVSANLARIDAFRQARHLLVCLSFGHEVDTHPLVAKLAADPLRAVYVPRVDSAGRMHVHPFPCDLERLPLGLHQPRPTEPEARANVIDVAVVVGLTFARDAGYRLGYGKGYFDRFFAETPHPYRIGLSFESVLADRLPVAPHDIPMDAVVTEEQIYRFPAASNPTRTSRVSPVSAAK